MKYKLSNIEKETLKSIFELFTEETLSVPIKENPKIYKDKVRGFRINKLPISKLVNIYYEDFKYKNSKCLNYLSKILENKFERLGVSSVMESYQGNIVDVFFRLKAIFFKEDIKFNPRIILDISGIEYDITIVNELEKGISYIVNEVESKDFSIQLNEKSHLNDRIEKLEKQLTEIKLEKDTIKDNLRSEEKDNKEKSNAINELQNKILKLESSNSELSNKNGILKQSLDLKTAEINEKVKMYMEEKAKIDIYDSEKEKAIITIEDLNKKIDVLKEKQISSEMIIEVVNSLLTSIENEAFDENSFIKMIKEKFNEKTTILDALRKIEVEEKEIIDHICNKMDEGVVEERDLDSLESLENIVCIKYMIYKSVKTLCFKYMEQKRDKQGIATCFLSKL